MNDLALWQRLRSRQPDDNLVADLNEMAGWPARERLPFLGLLLPFFRHSDSAVRRATVRCLNTCFGISAYETVIGALDDEEPSVREAAVETLRTTVTGGDWARWIHVLFHPRSDVRLAGLRADRTFPAPGWWVAFLLADPLCAARARECLVSVTWPTEALPLLIDFGQRGIMSRAEVRRAICGMAWPAIVDFLSRWGFRSLEACNAIADSLPATDGRERLLADATHDPLDDVLDFFSDATEPESIEWLITHVRTILSAEEHYRQRALASLLINLARRPPTGADYPLGRLIAVIDTFFLTCPWVPLAWRRSALQGFYDLREQVRKLEDEQVWSLLRRDICRRDDGLFDLWAVGAVLHLFGANPYERLLAKFPIIDLTKAFEIDPLRSLPFFGVADRTSKNRRFLIRELCMQARPERSRVLATLCETVPQDGLDFIEMLDASIARDVALELLERNPNLASKKRVHLTKLLANKLAAGQIGPFLLGWLAADNPEENAFGQALLTAVSRQVEPRFFEQVVATLAVPILHKFLAMIIHCTGFPYDQELAIARLLVDHGDEAIRSWAAARLQPAATRFKLLDPSVKEGILRAGLCQRLRAVPDPVKPDYLTCAALLVSHDLPAEIDAQFARFSSTDQSFINKLDEEMITNWRGEKRLPLFGHCWLYRWDDNAAELSRFMTEHGDSLDVMLKKADEFRSPVLRGRWWEALTRLLELWRWKDPVHLAGLWTSEAITVLIDHLVGDVGPTAARILMSARSHAPAAFALDDVRNQALIRLTSASDEVRSLLSSWVDTRGLETVSLPRQAVELAGQIVAEMALEACTDTKELLAHLFSIIDPLAPNVARLLVQRGEAARRLIVERFRDFTNASHTALLFSAEAGWPKDEHRDAVRQMVLDGAGAPEVRYRISIALNNNAERGLLPSLMHTLKEPSPTGWFNAHDWHDLRRAAELEGIEADDWFYPLAVSPHPHLYEPVVTLLCAAEPIDSWRTSINAFLECGTGRMRELRVQAAEALQRVGLAADALPILLQANAENPPKYPDLLARQPFDVVRAIVNGFLHLGHAEEDEWLIFNLLMDTGVDPFARDEGLTLLLPHLENKEVRKQVRDNVKRRSMRSLKLRRVADIFAWGIRVGRELTGKLFSIEMIAGGQLGYTRFNENKIYITPLPVLRGEMNGRQVVRALILHEYGHHMYHRGEVAEAIWKASQTEGLQKLLNLVSDEHLERNLRSLDRSFGDQLKMLGAYAFQHTARDIPVTELLLALRGRAFEVLSGSPLGVAKKTGSVAVHNGRVLMMMEKLGLSFARFVRALRMGLGNRHDDPKVEAGLALFQGKFRKSDMTKLMEITRKLRDIFGWETSILDSFDQDASLGDEASDWDEVSEGLTNEEVQTEVQNSLQGKKRTGNRERGSRWGINTNPDERFDLIERVEPIPHDPAAHGSYVQQVARPARLLRGFLKKLGVGMQATRFRLSGRSFDRARALAVVSRGEPRMLIARELRIHTDLFIGVVIDCSGSMSSGANIEKAKLFGTLIAEAGRNYPGVDVRLFGFTDQVIYDAGHANRCAVHGLEAGGGNNDAAGLWYAALAAKASRRRAKLLVMISDGAPTECSVSALKALVVRLDKRLKMCCAQVAVCPLEHQCFPNHILLDSDNVDASVRNFGHVMAKLVQKALRGG